MVFQKMALSLSTILQIFTLKIQQYGTIAEKGTIPFQELRPIME